MRKFIPIFLCLLLAMACSKEDKPFSVSNIPANGLLLSTSQDGFQVEYTGTADWSSTNPSVFQVNGSGYITIQSFGNANLVAKESDGTTHSYYVIVTSAVQVQSYKVQSSVEIAQGHYSDIELTDIVPDGANSKDFNYTLDPSGEGARVERLLDAPGKFRIYVDEGVADDKKFNLTFNTSSSVQRTTTVTAKYRPVTAFAFDQTSFDLSLREGCETATLTWTITPPNATVRDVSFVVNQYPDAAGPVISFNANTGEIVALNNGKATIEGTCGGFTSTCTVSVAEPKITSLTLTDSNSQVYVEPGDTRTLTSTQTPAGLYPFEWSNSSSEVVLKTLESGTKGESKCEATFKGATGWLTTTVTSGNMTATLDHYMANPSNGLDIHACKASSAVDPELHFPRAKNMDNTTTDVFPGEDVIFDFGFRDDKWYICSGPFDVCKDALDYTYYGYTYFPFDNRRQAGENLMLIAKSKRWYIYATTPGTATFSYRSKSVKVIYKFTLNCRIGSLSLLSKPAGTSTDLKVVQTRSYNSSGVYFTANASSENTTYCVYMNTGSGYNAETSQRANFWTGVGGSISSCSNGDFTLYANKTLNDFTFELSAAPVTKTGYTGYVTVHVTVN